MSMIGLKQARQALDSLVVAVYMWMYSEKFSTYFGIFFLGFPKPLVQECIEGWDGVLLQSTTVETIMGVSSGLTAEIAVNYLLTWLLAHNKGPF